MRMIGPILCASLLLSGCGDETQDSIEVRDAIAADWDALRRGTSRGAALGYCDPGSGDPILVQAALETHLENLGELESGDRVAINPDWPMDREHFTFIPASGDERAVVVGMVDSDINEPQWASYAAQSESGGLWYSSVYCNPPPA